MEDTHHTAGENDLVHTGEPAQQYVVFRLGEEEYAAPILDIQEIIPAGDITPFPNAPSYVQGIINVRGTVATVVSLAKLFGLQAEVSETEGYIILVKTDKTLFGVQVDTVSSVMNFSSSEVRSAEGVADMRINAEYVQGVAVVGDRVILILNLHHVLKEDGSELPEIPDVSTTATSTEASQGSTADAQSVSPVAPEITPTSNPTPPAGAA